ncbi:LCP family protein [Nocardia huaxiensis]|uniref:LCP family protein n=1 Tax=Nocardia huaxiensis TaxID=2755382 RepID=A0A7D6VHF9_9NOCA|nr:LCP family protein [Nocardia huaxiensis]QLY32895.1 LCP family protein [Nocardia huaxiensis]UFS93347.1 LCP family protein [Nocardia huaxiensis]
MRTLTAVAAALVLVLTGLGWHSVDQLVSSIERIGDLGLGGGKDGAVDILMVGIDARTDAHGNPLSDDERAMLHAGDEVGLNTDTIILIRVPNNGQSATAISIPRDSYVQIPGLGMGKINSAYGVTKLNEQQRLLDKGVSEKEADEKSSQAGRQALIKSVATLTGLTVDHYAEVGLLGFVLLTDAVGGVEVCLDNAVYEPMSGADFPAGRQKLDGAQALSFVRQRHELPRGDLDRIVRQQVYMAQLVHQVLSAKTLTSPTRLQALSDAVGRTVVLDDDWDVLKFLNQMQDLSGGKVSFETIPVKDLNGWTDDGESVVRVDPVAVQKYVAKTIGEDDGETYPETNGVDPATVTVDVYNASGVGGMAGSVATALQGKGFRTGTVDNWIGGPIQSTRVLTGDATSAKARAVAQALGGVNVMSEAGLSEGSIRVVLAGDYSGPGSAPATTMDFTSSTTMTPVPPAPPIDAGQNGPKCVN